MPTPNRNLPDDTTLHGCAAMMRFLAAFMLSMVAFFWALRGDMLPAVLFGLVSTFVWVIAVKLTVEVYRKRHAERAAQTDAQDEPTP